MNDLTLRSFNSRTIINGFDDVYIKTKPRESGYILIIHKFHEFLREEYLVSNFNEFYSIGQAFMDNGLQ